MEVTMKQIIVAQTSDFLNENKMKLAVENQEILLVKFEGSFYAVDNKCTHMGGSLYEGRLEGHTIVCPKHGTAFDVKTGQVSQGGKIAFIKVNPHNLHSYPVLIEGTNILVEID
ncbi:MAG: non-heme iron oxygenase ferredoxin subunit [Bacteroidia bacterium]|nr:non-heme iron oxygenase ferredoxin subunit [Bacteroidia bacterium]